MCQERPSLLSSTHFRYKIYSIKGSELKSQEFLEFIREDRESFIAAVSASFDDLHLDQNTKVKVISFLYSCNLISEVPSFIQFILHFSYSVTRH